MRVKVKFFAALREGIGKNELEIEIPSGSKLKELMELLKKEYGVIGKFQNPLALSINKEYAKGDELLKEGDEIALIPPVSGGGEMYVCLK